MSAIEISAAATIACGETSVRRFSRPNARGSWPCSPSEYASREKPEIDVVTAASRISAPVRPTKTRSAVAEPVGQRGRASCVDDPDQRRAQPVACRARSCRPCAGNAESATTAIAT